MAILYIRTHAVHPHLREVAAALDGKTTATEGSMKKRRRLRFHRGSPWLSFHCFNSNGTFTLRNGQESLRTAKNPSKMADKSTELENNPPVPGFRSIRHLSASPRKATLWTDSLTFPREAEGSRTRIVSNGRKDDGIPRWQKEGGRQVSTQCRPRFQWNTKGSAPNKVERSLQSLRMPIERHF